MQREYKENVTISWLMHVNDQYMISKLLKDCKCRPMLMEKNVFWSKLGYNNREHCFCYYFLIVNTHLFKRNLQLPATVITYP